MSLNFNYINYLEDATPVTYSNQESTFPASNVTHPFRSKSWRTQAGYVTNQYIIFDAGWQVRPTTFILINEQRGIQLSPNATITVEGSNDGNFGTPVVSVSIPWDSQFIYKYHATAFGACRFYKVKISDPYSIDNYIEVGNMYLGETLNFTSTDLNLGWDDTKIDDSIKTESDGGEPWFDVKTKRDKYGFEFKYMSKEDRDNIEEMMRTVGKHKPLYISLDPELKISASQAELSRYVRFTKDATFSNVFYRLYNLQMEVEEAI